jgi:hypothetical protein
MGNRRETITASGDPTPSTEDIATTAKLMAAGKLSPLSHHESLLSFALWLADTVLDAAASPPLSMQGALGPSPAAPLHAGRLRDALGVPFLYERPWFRSICPPCL